MPDGDENAIDGQIRHGIGLNECNMRCSTTGPSARAGKKLSAPITMTTVTSNTTNSGVCVGKVPGPAGIAFLAASEPAIPRTGTLRRSFDHQHLAGRNARSPDQFHLSSHQPNRRPSHGRRNLACLHFNLRQTEATAQGPGFNSGALCCFQFIEVKIAD